ncbi:MAG: outer membrane protein assembly factor BamE [Planctomycetota bacterium]
MRRSTSVRELRVAVAAAALAQVAYVPFAVGELRYGNAFEFFQRRPFDRETWLRPAGPHDRLRQIDDLVDHRLRAGMSRADVTWLLGPPTRTTRFSGWDLVYYLGLERSPFGVDSEWLVARFDPSGRLSEFAIARD